MFITLNDPYRAGSTYGRIKQKSIENMLDIVNYTRGDGELTENFKRAGKLIRAFNQLEYGETESQQRIIKELFGTVGTNAVIEHNFHCDLGYNIHVGQNFYAGYNCTILDMAVVRIGDNCLLGPNVGIYTAGHNLSPIDRHRTGFAKPITIGKNVWIGGHCAIVGGITIGDNSIVAAGSVVIKDIPPNSVYGGNPAKFIKPIEN